MYEYVFSSRMEQSVVLYARGPLTVLVTLMSYNSTSVPPRLKMTTDYRTLIGSHTKV